MLENYHIENILFLDIETVPQTASFEELPLELQLLWEKKANQLSRFGKPAAEENHAAAELYERAGIYAEFGKVICISTGIFRYGELTIKSFWGDDEKLLLLSFGEMLHKSTEKKINRLCAHNGKEFDFPYLNRRMLVNGLKIPAILDLSEKKPWEVNHLDTMELWKFGDYKCYTSLELLAAVFGIPTPKDEIRNMTCRVSSPIARKMSLPSSTFFSGSKGSPRSETKL